MSTQIEKTNRLITEMFGPLTDNDNKLIHNEYISITKINSNSTREEYFDDLKEALEYATRKDKYYYNTYFSLATTDGSGRTTDRLKRRSCLAFDFDKKDFPEDFNYIDIMYLFKNIRLYYHAIVDTGHGFHVYVFIEPTDDLQVVEKVQRAIAIKVNADLKATLKTQIMRLPSTINVKDVKEKKYVNIVYLADQEKIKRLPIEHYRYNYATESTNKNIKYAMQNKYLPECAKEILKGSKDGEKNEDLQKLIVVLKRQGKTLPEIKAIVSEWQENTETKLERLDYQVEYMYENLKNGTLNCSECSHNRECYTSVIEAEDDGESKVILDTRAVDKVKNKKSKRKGVKKMTGDMLIIYTILKKYHEGLYREEILKAITYNPAKNKPFLKENNLEEVLEFRVFQDRKLGNVLKELVDNRFITEERIGNKKFYKIKEKELKEEHKLSISYGATDKVIEGDITTSEYELYCYMKYLNHMQHLQEGKNIYNRTDILRVNQKDLAEDLGVTQGRISQMIENLVRERLLLIYYRGKKENTNFMYNTYLLNK